MGREEEFCGVLNDETLKELNNYNYQCNIIKIFLIFKLLI
jgi:hypothetical protein